MPKDTIERAIKKASGADADSYEQMTFEGYGPHGIAFFIECTTDNTNRTIASVRSIFSKNGGSLGTNGSLEFLFDRKGVFTLDKAVIERDWEMLQLELIEGGAESFENHEDVFVIYTEFTDFGKMAQHLEELNIETKNAELQRIPLNTVELPINQAQQILNLAEKFEDDDDVQNVFHTLELSEELAMALDEEE